MSINAGDAPHVAVVIPCYKVRQHILAVLNNIGAEVSTIFVIDDCCPEASGEFVQQHNQDSRVKIITHTENQGVGGAVMTGYQAAIAEGANIIVKVDGDGQMNPALIPYFVQPIAAGEADYTKGNRFFDLEEIRAMPRVRLSSSSSCFMRPKVRSKQS